MVQLGTMTFFLRAKLRKSLVTFRSKNNKNETPSLCFPTESRCFLEGLHADMTHLAVNSRLTMQGRQEGGVSTAGHKDCCIYQWLLIWSIRSCPLKYLLSSAVGHHFLLGHSNFLGHFLSLLCWILPSSQSHIGLPQGSVFSLLLCSPYTQPLGGISF